MAQKYSITSGEDDLKKITTRALQSGHISFLIGSGASSPAISIAGDIEKDLNDLLEAGAGKADEFTKKKFEFLRDIQRCTNALISRKEAGDDKNVLDQYRTLLKVVTAILEERKTNLLSKQVTLFTSNYDLFVERASEDVANLHLNDGFSRTPALSNSFPYEPERFFDVTYRTGNLFNYQFPFPSVNLVKIHGSVSWVINGGQLVHSISERQIPDEKTKDFLEEAATFGDGFSLILPTKRKFQETLMERIYYDLLRIFANTLEIETSFLMVFGFSFADEHILDITKRALKNPTLLILIFAYSEKDVAGYEQKFGRYNNVIICHPEDKEKLDFERFNAFLRSLIPIPEA